MRFNGEGCAMRYLVKLAAAGAALVTALAAAPVWAGEAGAYHILPTPAYEARTGRAPQRTFVAVRAMTPVTGIPPKIPIVTLAIPCPINS